MRGTTFREAAERFITGNKAGWRNAKHRAQWGSTLATYAYPHMGDLPVADVATEHVLAALHPIWTTKPETAARVTWPYRGGAGLCSRDGTADRGQPRPVAGAPVQHPASTLAGGARGTPCGAALAGRGDVHGGAARPARHGCPRARVCHPDGRPVRGSAGRAVVRNRHGCGALDRSPNTDEGQEGAPRPPYTGRAGDPEWTWQGCD